MAITGFGALSSLGYGAEQIAENIRNGVDGSLSVSADDWLGSGEQAHDLNQLMQANPALAERLAGMTEADLRAMQFRAHEVRGIEARKHLKNYDPRKASRIGTHGLLAVEQALQSGGRKVRHGDTDVALIMGMSKGPQATIARYAQSLHPDPKRARTFEFPSALMNSTATFCAISKGLKGYNTTLSTGYNAGLGALLYGYELVRQGLQPQALVGGAEENAYSSVLMSPATADRLCWSDAADAFQVYGANPSGFTLGEGAAVALLEDLDAAHARGAQVLGVVLGYGRSCDAAYPGESGLAAGNAMIAAIQQALAEAGLQASEVDLICGTSWGTGDSAQKELDAVRAVFGALAAEVPLVNYNGHFGFVESAAGLLNLAQVLQIMRSGEIAPIPYTREFCADDIAFVRQPLRREVRHALVLGASDGGNNYALLVRKDG